MRSQVLDLRGYLTALRRHLVLLLVVAVLGGALGIAVTFARPPAWASTSQVLLPPQPKDSSGQSSQRDVGTYVRVTESDAVLAASLRDLRIKGTTQALAERLAVSAPTEDVIQVKARGATPRQAEALARSVAKGLVGYLQDAASSGQRAESEALAARQKRLQATLSSVRQQIRATQSRIRTEVTGSTAATQDATTVARLTGEQADLVLQIANASDNRVGTSQGTLTTLGLGASVIQDASPALRPALVLLYLVGGGLGVLVALLVAAAAVALWARRDRRLYFRDRIADAIGAPVLASLDSADPRSAAGWVDLLEGYHPSTVDAWALRQVLRRVGQGESAETSISALSARKAHRSTRTTRSSVLVVALSDDPRGLTLGPQLASYAASTGVETCLVVAQRHDSATTLWAAGASAVQDGRVRQHLSVVTTPRSAHDAELTVVLAVLDRRDPQLIDLPRTTTTLLAVAAGNATGEDLARAAVCADDAERRIEGILVADPDRLDDTTGRLSLHERSQQVALPIRLTGATASGNSRVLDGGRRRS